MKKLPYAFLWLPLLVAVPAFAQNLAPRDIQQPTAEAASSSLTKFDLDFPGGSPNDLVAAMEKAIGRPLNAVVPTQYSNFTLPSLKMKGIDAAQLFQALERASHSNRRFSVPGGFSYGKVSYGFGTVGPFSDNSVWFFYFEGPSLDKVSRFFLLTPYLDRGLTVDDITTAIQTGWKMLGLAPAPELSFHKETNLLIAVGEEDQLETIDHVLKALDTPVMPKRAKPHPQVAD